MFYFLFSRRFIRGASHPSHPLNYSYDGIIFFGGDAEGVAVVVRALVGEISVVVTTTDGCVDLVHGDV